MNPQAIAAEILSWLRTIIGFLLLLVIAATMLRAVGISIPIRGPGHVELAYLAGAYWLSR